MNGDIILKENKNSRILAELGKIPYTLRHVQSIKENYPNNFKSVIEIAPENTNISTTLKEDYIIRFKLPNAGFLRDLMIKSTFTIDTTAEDITNMGHYLYKSIELRQRNKCLFFQNTAYTFQRSEDTASDVNENLNLLSGSGTNGSETFSVYTKLWSFIFDREDNNILLDFSKDLEVWITLNKDILETFDELTIVSDYKPVLLCYRTIYEPEFINSYILENFMKNTTNYLQYNIMPLTVDAGSLGTTSTMLKQNLLVSAIHISLLNGNTIINNVEGFKLYLGGQKLIDCDRYNNLLNNQEMNKTVAKEGSLSYYFGTRSRLGFSGACDFSNKALRLDIDHYIGSGYKIVINLEYINVISLHKNNGEFLENAIH